MKHLASTPTTITALLLLLVPTSAKLGNTKPKLDKDHSCNWDLLGATRCLPPEGPGRPYWIVSCKGDAWYGENWVKIDECKDGRGCIDPPGYGKDGRAYCEGGPKRFGIDAWNEE